jgi:uncharacterized protein (TIGR02145 family)
MKSKQTRPASLIIILVLMVQFLNSQNYLITFSGSGQSSMVETVEVKNVNQQTTLTLIGSDTLLLTDVVGIGYMPSLNKGLTLYPNPAIHASRLEFYNSCAGNTSVDIYDFSGRLLIRNSSQLIAGSHAFIIRGLNAGIYLLKINTPEHIYSQRLVLTSAHHSVPELQYDGRTQSSQSELELKGISNILGMQFNEGERLVFKAISGDYVHTKSLVPTQSQNIDFEFIDCIDFDGNHYGVVTMGEQVWVDENLKTTHYRNGTPILYPGNDTIAWHENLTGAYAWYDNDIVWKHSYGALYNWFASTNANGLCPIGWHVPGIAEWSQLVDYVVEEGFSNHWGDLNGAGNALKSCRQVNSPLGGNCNTIEHPAWNEHDPYHGFDAFGFSGLPGGCRHIEGSFLIVGTHSFWWSSTGGAENTAWFRDLSYGGSTLNMSNILGRGFGMSIRCVRN